MKTNKRDISCHDNGNIPGLRLFFKRGISFRPFQQCIVAECLSNGSECKFHIPRGKPAVPELLVLNKFFQVLPVFPFFPPERIPDDLSQFGKAFYPFSKCHC